MDRTMLTIGQLAHRSGVPARTIRFWSDEGVVPVSERSGNNYRRYDAAAVATLDLVKTLRELGLGLEQVRAVLAKQRSVEDVAAEHIRAIDASIRVLRTQRAVCTLMARDSPSPRKVTIMNALSRLSAAERQNLIDEFVDATFAGTDPGAPGAGIADGMRRLPAELPDEPTTEQVEAWIELAELVRDPAFRARTRDMAVAGSAAPTEGTPSYDTSTISQTVQEALTDGVEPGSAEGQRILTGLLTKEHSREERLALAAQVELFSDRRVERYWELLGILNGRPPFPRAVPAFEWFAAALRA